MRLGELIRDWRTLNTVRDQKGYGIREVARQIGIGHATLSRIERGEDFDSQTMAKILLWLFNQTTEGNPQ
jgi:transcriptional regulator with XRE-family HTH domain